eukprot:3662093-Pleurochrysis_carterae.AAC.1
MWNEAGLEKKEEYSFDRDANGVPLDETVESEWGMTIDAPFAPNVADVESAVRTGIGEPEQADRPVRKLVAVVLGACWLR